jgi:alpha-soluble NSF attachment protein|eukprot:TRINITY_DN49752_c0_g1_i1.p1 TRINITY_DN49752_c0_g1~~TRINITY_DN49752_c0_g1_i1.p1  ORF type:complete len:316 (+),score=94.46 TRINITY_DN49752_c0_g1_i1:63-950(+)
MSAAGAKALVQQAEQKLKGGFLSFLTGGPKYDEACELYQQAANQYKLAKEWNEAANCFVQCAFCSKESGSQNDEANFYVEAGSVLKKVSSAEAVEQFEKAIGLLSLSGRFQQSGKLLVQVAELFEAERLTHKEAKEYYKRAAEMFELVDHGKSDLTKCNLKVAEYSAKDGDINEAIKIFESEGEKALQNTLLQYNAKEHFLRAGILHLVNGDSVTASMANEKYRMLDPRFASSREGELLQGLTEAFEGNDLDAFLDKLQAYDQITRLDAWKTDFLVKVQQAMSNPEGPEDEADLT